MADDAEKPKTAARPRRTRAAAAKDEPAPKKSEAAAKAPEGPKAPRRPTLSGETARLLGVRRQTSRRRAKFTRQASYRYWRIGRDGAWRRPRGLQSKQRRHYQYRSTVPGIGFRGPAVARGRTSTGFVPVLVHNDREIERVDPAGEAAIIAHGVGTRRRLALEEKARLRGVHVLNPIVHDEEEHT